MSFSSDYMLISHMQALRTSDDASNPVYVSVGHKISLETATQLVTACSRKRIPEPVRQVCLWLPSIVCARRFEVRIMLRGCTCAWPCSGKMTRYNMIFSW